MKQLKANRLPLVALAILIIVLTGSQPLLAANNNKTPTEIQTLHVKAKKLSNEAKRLSDSEKMLEQKLDTVKKQLKEITAEQEEITKRLNELNQQNSASQTTKTSETQPQPAQHPGETPAFKIEIVSYTHRIISDGARGDIAVTWSGNLKFPAKIIYRLGADSRCPENVTCASPEMSFAASANPLVFPGVVWCTGAKQSYSADFEVVLVDADGVQSNAYPAPFDCIAP